jgi:hypothetical protein
MPLSDEQAKAAYDRTLDEPEEKCDYWVVGVTVTRTYNICVCGTRQQAEYQAMFDVGSDPENYDEQEVRITDTYKED